MSLFVLDTAGDKSLFQTNDNKRINICKQTVLEPKVREQINTELIENSDDECLEDEFFGLPPPSVDLKNIISDALAKTTKYNEVAHEVAHANERIDEAFKNASRPKKWSEERINIDHSDFNTLTKSYDADAQLSKINVQKELSKSILSNGLEQLKSLPVLSKEKQRHINRLERAKTKGDNWYGLAAQELTEEVQNDLKILKMRSVLDPKHFYKKNDLKVLPKYFQIGTVLHSPLDYYNERDTRRNKKRSLVDELLADKEFQKFNKRKYNEIMSRRDYYSRKKALKKLKKLKQ